MLPNPTPKAAYLAAAAVLLLDRLTKWLIESRVGQYEVIEVIPGLFNIIHARNEGAAFSMLAQSDARWRDPLLIGVSVAALVLVVLLLRNTSNLERGGAWALALILGGAAGNLFDRLAFGSVTDFLDFYVGSAHWPAFNVADSAIVCGSALLLLGMLWGRQPAQT